MFIFRILIVWYKAWIGNLLTGGQNIHSVFHTYWTFKLELWTLMRLYRHEFWTMGFGIILWIWTLLGFKGDFPKIHDSVDIVQVANEMKPCGVKILSSIDIKHNPKISLKAIFYPKEKKIKYKEASSSRS